MAKTSLKEKIEGTGPPTMKEGHHYINPDQDDQMEIIGFSPSMPKAIAMWSLMLVTAGLLRLYFYWFPHLMVRSTHTRCDLHKAKVVLLKDQYKQWFIARVKTDQDNGSPNSWTKSEKQSMSGSSAAMLGDSMTPLRDVLGDTFASSTSKYFVTKKVKYIWDNDLNVFEKMRGLEENTNCSYFYTLEGLTSEEQMLRRVQYGINSIRVHVNPILEILLKQAMTPFYIFQMFSVALWFWEQYYYYTSSILALSIVSLTSFVYQTRKMQRALRNTIAMSSTVSVCRGGKVYEEISSDELVPGDVIEIPKQGCMMQCDAVLLSGNCVVNESMLTGMDVTIVIGESVPMTKTPLTRHDQSDEKMFDIREHARHVLFCGTKVIQTRQQGQDKVKAVVIRTGFSTSKGMLVRSILYPKPMEFKFQRDSYIFVGFLAVIGAIGFTYTVTLMVRRGNTVNDIIFSSMDAVTTAVPAALPLALTIGIVLAQNRLKNRAIYCISPNSINVSGTVNVFCFDKTGTLTEDGLKLQGVVPVSKNRFLEETEHVQDLKGTSLFTAMATCHSLTVIEGQTAGDPLDLLMYEATASTLTDTEDSYFHGDVPVPTVINMPSIHGDTTESVGIAKQFTFTSSLQRMSVIVTRQESGGYNQTLYCKGAPEMIASLSQPDTVPDDFHEVLESYTKHGYRVLAVGGRDLRVNLRQNQLQKLTRDEMETDLTFLGLLVLENCLKRETTAVIHQLQEASIKTVMITGDNLLTALSVAEDCGIVQERDRVVLVKAKDIKNGTESTQLEYICRHSNSESPYSNGGADLYTNVNLDDHTNISFAMDGKTWEIIRQDFPDLVPKLVFKGAVFARMSPEQKAQLVESIQELGYYVGMCGDGANDCGALKMAHAGISLSEAEASVASPFTSKHPNIECVPTLIREGRAGLVTSFGIFKFMACYSLTEFTSLCILYWVSSNMSDFQYLYVDMFLLTTLAVTFGWTSGYDYLTRIPPITNLFSVGPVLSLLTLVSIQIAFQVLCFLHVQQQVWFVPLVSRFDYDYESYQNNAVYLMSCFQYIVLAIALSKGQPYRRSMFSNYWFLGNIVMCTSVTLWLTIYPTAGSIKFLKLKPFPSITYRLLYPGLALLDLLLCVLLEDFVISGKVLSYKLQTKLEECLFGRRHKYLLLEEEMEDSDWPPVSFSSPIKAVKSHAMIEEPDYTNNPDSNVSIQDETHTRIRSNGLNKQFNILSEKL